MNGRELLIGVTGGIAAFKTAALVSRLVQAGAGVSVIMTEAACKLIGPATFEALTRRPVCRTMFGHPQMHPMGAHIELADRAELFCVAPATANFLGKAAMGLADDPLSTTYLSFAGPTLVAPAMNSHMWESPSVVRNVRQLQVDGVFVIDPEVGWLSCGTIGAGRMAAPETIFQAIEQLLPDNSP